VFANVEVQSNYSGNLRIVRGGESYANVQPTVNYQDNGPTSSGVMLRLSSGGKILIYNSSGGPVNFKVDIQGYFSGHPDEGGSYTPLAPVSIYAATPTIGNALGAAETRTIPVAGVAAADALAAGDDCDDGRRIYEVTRRMITMLIRDVIGETRIRLRSLAPESPEDIRDAGRATVAFSNAMTLDVARLKAFLFERVYRHARVMRVMSGAEQIVRDLFARYRSHPHHLPDTWASAAANLPERKRARLIGDFVAGMTDRYALAEHRHLFDATPDLR